MGTSHEAIRRKVENRSYLKYTKSLKLTSINVFTYVDNTWRFTNATPCDMKDSIKDIRMSIVHANSASHLSKWKTSLMDFSHKQLCSRGGPLVDSRVIDF